LTEAAEKYEDMAECCRQLGQLEDAMPREIRDLLMNCSRHFLFDLKTQATLISRLKHQPHIRDSPHVRHVFELEAKIGLELRTAANDQIQLFDQLLSKLAAHHHDHEGKATCLKKKADIYRLISELSDGLERDEATNLSDSFYLEAGGLASKHLQEKVYLFGGFKVLEFDVKSATIAAAKSQPKVSLPKRTQCHYLKEVDRIATVGGLVDGKPSPAAFLFSPADLSKARSLPDFPFPVTRVAMAFWQKKLLVVGGETVEGQASRLSSQVWSLDLSRKEDEELKGWKKLAELPISRRDANVLLVGEKLLVFGGATDGGVLPVQVDSVELGSGKSKSESYSLPSGVEGARLCWSGDGLLLVGGRRQNGATDSSVLQIDFERQSVMSRRRLTRPRDFPLVLPQTADEFFVFGGANSYSAERHEWSEALGDYCFREAKIEGQLFVDSPTGYESALPTFSLQPEASEYFPTVDESSGLVFGDEEDCFLLEVSGSLQLVASKASMRFPLCSGQAAVFAGGLHRRSGSASARVSQVRFSSREVRELPSLLEERYRSALVEVNQRLVAVGGFGPTHNPTAATELLSFSDSEPRWRQVEPMRVARVGHVAWADEHLVFVVGGRSRVKGPNLETIEMLNTETNGWSEYPFPCEIPLFGAQSFVDGDSLYLIGGEDSQRQPTRNIYRLNKSRPEQFSLVAKMEHARVHCKVWRIDGRVVVLGGSSSNAIEVFSHKSFLPERGIEARSQNLFLKLASFTSRLGLEDFCSV
jgi:14-3-3 protein/Kelch motif